MRKTAFFSTQRRKARRVPLSRPPGGRAFVFTLYRIRFEVFEFVLLFPMVNDGMAVGDIKRAMFVKGDIA